MSRITARFEQLRSRREKGLIVYLTAGDPSLDESVALVCAAANAGADVVELGVPWSDPSADGPVIQRAMERALRSGTTLRKTLDAVAAIRRRCEVPIVLFGYYNPIFSLGVDETAARAATCGVDGVLTVDLPIEEADELDAPLRARGIAPIPLLAPTTSPERAARQAARGTGFAYYVSLTGITGAGHLNAASVEERVAALRPKLGTLPLAVGFGIKDPAAARAVARSADAVVVGSALVELVEKSPDAATRERALVEQIAAFKRAL